MELNNTVQSVIRALDIIEILQQGELGLFEISKKVNLNKSTVHRLLSTLIVKGYVIQNPDNSKYRLSFKLLKIGSSLLDSIDIINISRPFLRELSKKTNEVVHLVAFEKDHAVYIDKLESQNTIRMHSYIGKNIPLYSTAVGKTYLAFISQREFLYTWELIKDSIIKLTDKTITDKDKMIKELKRIRETGYAIDNEENEENIICIASPIFNYKGNIQYAISISIPKIRMTEERLEEFKDLILDATRRISKELGYSME